MTEADLQDLRVINSSMAALKEIQQLPEQDEYSLLRAMANTYAINKACHSIMARAECAELLQMVAA